MLPFIFWGLILGAIILLVIGIARRSNPLIVVGAVSIAVLVGFIGLPFLAVRSLIPTTNPQQYKKIISKARSTPLTDHFPRTIPADARNIHLYYNPGPLQAATILQLRYTTTPEQIADLTTRFTPKAIKTISGDDPYVMKPTFFTGDRNQSPQDTGLGSFSPDFQILVLYRDPAHTAEPTYSGVAISEKRNEIVYWMED